MSSTNARPGATAMDLSEADADLQAPARAGWWTAWLSLAASGGTLVCCALPALLVSVGLGAALAGLVSTVPALVWLSEAKGLVFGLAGAMLAAAGVLQWRARSAPCPLDPRLRQACLRTRRWSRGVWVAAVVVYATGAFFAFVLPWVMLGAEAG
ncbi:MAG: hypothetical protein LW854_10360 [Rubrivivax sp.]|nr:hypothetical protein [Rubrivivax sp.]